MKKPKVNQDRGYIPFSKQIDWPSGTLEEIREMLDKIETDYHHVENKVIDYKWSGYEDCYYFLFGTIKETNEEWENRVQAEKEALERWEKEEGAQKIKELEERLRIQKEKVDAFNKLKEELTKDGLI